MATTNDIYAEMQRYAPLELAESWDNPGLLVDCGGAVRRVLVTLDITRRWWQKLRQSSAQSSWRITRSSLTRSSGCAPPMCPISWCRRAFPPFVCTRIWMPPRAG